MFHSALGVPGVEVEADTHRPCICLLSFHFHSDSEQWLAGTVGKGKGRDPWPRWMNRFQNLVNLMWLWEPRRFRIIRVQEKKYLGKSLESAGLKPCLYSSVYLKSLLFLVNGSAPGEKTIKITTGCTGTSKMGRGNLPGAKSECRLDLKLWQAFFSPENFSLIFFFFF